jgi:hypothetical protein
MTRNLHGQRGVQRVDEKIIERATVDLVDDSLYQ